MRACDDRIFHRQRIGTAVTQKAKTLDALTGLRFIAALAVFVHHISGKFSIPDVKWPMGNQAVSFFFVLSGFILTYVYSERLKLANVAKFYFTRWARIWPLHIVCLLLMLGFVHNLRVFGTDPQHWGKLFANIFLVQSWIPNTSYVFGFNGVSWSISTEMFFYIMFPLFLLGGQKQFWYKYAGLLLMTLAIVVGVTMVSHTNWFPNVDYTRLGHNNPLLRLPEFCTGMAVGYIYLNRQKVKAAMETTRSRSFALDTVMEILAFGAIFGYMWLLKKSAILHHIKTAEWGGAFPSSFLTFTSGCFVFAGVIYIFSKSSGLIARFCSTRAMVFLGEVSFAFYMIHSLVIRLVIMHFGEFYGALPPVVLATVIGLIALAASIVLFKIVEMPCKNGLLAFYNRKWTTGLWTVPKAALDFSRTRVFAFTAVMAIVSVLVLNQYKSSSASPSQIREVVRNSDPEFRGIRFGHAIELMGYDVETKKGKLHVKLAWRKRADFSHFRYIHICDENGEVVGNCPREEKQFRNAEVGDQIIDSFYIPKEKLAQGSQISIGFHGGRGVGMMKVDRGPRSMKNRRLDLISPEKFTQLAASLNLNEGERVAELDTNKQTNKQ